MSEKFELLKRKLILLKCSNSAFRVFGAKHHKYELNETISEEKLISFEKANSIFLPDDYKTFLTKIGNGGTGPNYGLQPIEKARLANLDYEDLNDLIDLTKPFKFTEKWNFDFGDLESIDGHNLKQLEDEYFSNKWIDGIIRLSNAGCGNYISLIVNGEDYDKVWIDGRCGDYGLYPLLVDNKKVSFFEWYENWLDFELTIRHIDPSDKSMILKVKTDEEKRKGIIKSVKSWIRRKKAGNKN